MKLRKWIRRVALALGGTAIVAMIGFALLQTGPGRALAVALIEGAASSENFSLKIEGLEGTLPHAPRAAKVTLSDRTGPWAVIENAAVTWSPFALIGGEIAIDDLSVARVEWLREPEGGGDGEGGTLPPLAIGRLKIATVALAPEIAGTPAVFALEGSADLRDVARRAKLDLKLVERLENGARVALRGDYDPAVNKLDLSASIGDAAGGTLATILELPADAPLIADLKSNGTLDNWRAMLTASGGGALTALGTATIARRGAWRELKLQLASTIDAIGPASLRPLYEGQTSIELAAAQSDGGAWRVDRLSALTPAFTLDAKGLFDAAAKRWNGNATLQAREGGALGALIGQNIDWRDLTLNAKLDGPWPAPPLTVDLTAADVTAEGIKASTFTARLTAKPDGRWDSAATNVAIAGRADAGGLATDDAVLRGLLGDTATMSVKANAIGRARLTGIVAELATTPATLRFTGDADAKALAGVLALDAPDLARAGMKGGAAALTTSIAANLDTAAWNAEGKGTIKGLALGDDIDRLLAGFGTLDFAATGTAFDKLNVTSLTLDGKDASLIASGAVGRDKLDAEARLTLADLALISPAHAGRAVVDIHATGTPANPRFAGRGDLSDGKLFGRPVKSLAVTLAEPDAKGMSRFAVDGDYAGKPAKGAADIAWSSDGGARVDGLKLQLASVALEGAAVIDANALIRGSAKIDAGDVADVAPLIGEDLAGPLKSDLRFDAATGQTVTVALASPRLRFETATFASLSANGTISDPVGAASLDLRARAAAADLDGFALQALDATGTGSLRALIVSATARREATTAKAKATLDLWAKPSVLALETLDLSRGDKVARLAAPVTIALGGGRVLIPAARIAADKGSLTIEGDAGRATDLALTANALPLWVAGFAADPLPATGLVSGSARVRQRGAVTFELKATNLAPEGEARIVRNLTLTASGETDRGGATFKLTLADPARTSFRAEGRMPFAGNAPLAVAVDGTADLALANAYLGVTGDRARGTLTIAAKLSGTRLAPRIAGTGRIANGHFRSAESGFELKDIAAEFEGSERSVTVSSLKAAAPNGGTLSGKGSIRLEPANAYPLELSLAASNAQLVATDVTTVVANVDARMSGGLFARPTIGGTVDVERWEIRLPEKLARPLNPIRVTHRNAPPEVLARLPVEEEDADSGLQFGLDLTVRAPQRVFVRGQGVDAEFGGRVKVAGTVDDPTASGRFELRRGAVSVLSQRITLTRGDIVFSGPIVPTLDIAGDVRKTGLVATVAVKGKANAPEIKLSSSPTLPQDEIIARILFNKSVQQLSAFEAVQLAAAIARWSGLSTGPDILESLRSGLGIDTLSAVTDTGGGSALGAGTYVGSGVYVGFVQGTDTAAGRATVDIDLTEEIKLRGEAGPTGDTRIGVVAEWEY